MLYEHWAKVMQNETISTPIFVGCYSVFQSKVCCPEFWYNLSGQNSGITCLASKFDLSNL